MALFLVRYPGPKAFLVRAQNRDHLNFILDMELDPGLCIAEVYDGPLCLGLELPATFEPADADEDGPAQLDLDINDGPHLRYHGSTNGLDVASTPALNAWGEVGTEMLEAFRATVFPAFADAVDTQLDQPQEIDDIEVDPTVLAGAIVRDIDDADTQLDILRRSQPARTPAEDALHAQFDVSRIEFGSLLRGGEVDREWGRGPDWQPANESTGADEPTDADDEAGLGIAFAYLDDDDRAHPFDLGAFVTLTRGTDSRPDLAGKRVRFTVQFLDRGTMHSEYFVLTFGDDGRPDPEQTRALANALSLGAFGEISTASRFVLSGFQWQPTAAQDDALLRASIQDLRLS